MWPRNDGTYVTPQGVQAVQPSQAERQAAEIAYLTALSRAGIDPSVLKNYAQNAANGPYNPELDELDVTDSEFENDSEFDSEFDDSEQENEAVVSNNIQQNPHNNYNALAAMNMHQQMQGHSVNDSNYGGVNALAALTQLSALAAPTFSTPNHGTPNQSVSNSSNASHHSAVNALTMSQQSTPAAHWKSAQPNIQGNHMQQNHGYINTGYSTSGVNPRDQNGNDDRAAHNISENDQKRKNIPVKKRLPTNPTPPTECNVIRPRTQVQRREAGAYLYQIQRREMEEYFTSIESDSPSRIKDMTASLKRLKLPRSHFSKISQLFQRNKTPSQNLNNTLPESQDSVTLPSSRQSNEELDGMDELQKIKTSQEFLTPSENESLWTSSEHQTDLRPTSTDDEKSIQALHFRSNFPDHFLGIRLLRLGIEDVQKIIGQVDLFENVREKLTEAIATESLSGPALMSCDLFELRKSLDLNLGTWTMFEQLIIGLRHIQNNELLKLGIQKQLILTTTLNGETCPGNFNTLNGETDPANFNTPS